MLKPQLLVLQAEHVEILQRHLRTGKTEHRTARRSRILLLRSEGIGPSEVALRLGCGRNTVWRIEETSTLHYNREFAHPFDWSFTRNRFHEWRRSKTSSTEP